MPGECGGFFFFLFFCAKIAESIAMSFVPAGWVLTVEILPSVCPHSTGLLAGICWKESQKSSNGEGGGHGYK